MAFEDALATWLVRQRWFAGKGRELRDLAIVADTEIISGDPELRHLILAVSHGTTVDYYQVLAGLRHGLPDQDPCADEAGKGDGRKSEPGTPIPPEQQEKGQDAERKDDAGKAALDEWLYGDGRGRYGDP